MKEQQTKGPLLRYGAIGFVALLLVVGLFLRNSNTEAQPNEPEQAEEQQTEEQPTETQGSNQQGSGGSEGVNNQDSSSDEASEEDEAASNFEDSELETTKELGEEFARELYEINGDEPLKNLEKAGEYATDNLKGMLESLDRQPDGVNDNSHFYSRKAIRIEMVEPEQRTDDFITWRAEIEGEYFDREGEKSADDETIYILQFIKVDDEFKVSEFLLHPNE